MKVTGWQHYRAQFAALHEWFPVMKMEVYRSEREAETKQCDEAGNEQQQFLELPNSETTLGLRCNIASSH